MKKSLSFFMIILFCLTFQLACSEDKEDNKATVTINNISDSLVLISTATLDGSDAFTIIIGPVPNGYVLPNSGLFSSLEGIKVPAGTFYVKWYLCNTAVDCIGDDSNPGPAVCGDLCDSNALCYTDEPPGDNPGNLCGTSYNATKDLVAGTSYTINFKNAGAYDFL